MAKSLEETLKDLRAGGYSEGGIRNWLVNKGFPSVKVDKAMAMRIAKDSSATDRRSRLHRALDCVLDSARVRDGLTLMWQYGPLGRAVQINLTESGKKNYRLFQNNTLKKGKATREEADQWLQPTGKEHNP
jgi:hypothetical protein